MEEARQISVIAQADVCVLGGSCTGVFAAVRAARLGLKVVIVEWHNCFGGVATNSLVNVWHSLNNTDQTRQVISGLTEEVLERLEKRNAVLRHKQVYMLNTEELKIELDQLVLESRIKPYLHTMFTAPYVKDEELIGVIVENKDGRGIILADVFIDATGDADLAHRLGMETYVSNRLQPGTTCVKLSGLSKIAQSGKSFGQLYLEHRNEFNLPESFAWTGNIPGESYDIRMLASTRVSANLSSADSLTMGEIEGRRQVRATIDLLKAHCENVDPVILSLPSRIGIRETRHVRCQHHINGEELLYGTRYPDAIANGTYPSDLHHTDQSGITFRYLNGEQRLSRPGRESVVSHWREPLEEDPTFYQIPYRAMVPQDSRYPNVIVAGRMIDADMIAHAAIRVMVNMNQTGEAAGTAAYLALTQGISFADVDPQQLRQQLSAGGSTII